MRRTSKIDTPRTRPAIVITAAIVCLTFCSCSSPPPARVGLPPAPVKTPTSALWLQIDTLLDDSALAPALIGVKIVSVGDGVTLYERNGGKLFHPASNMKLLTTGSALNLLRSDFAFRTILTADSTMHGNVLRGNLYVKGSGDPLLTADDLDSLASGVWRAGIRRVSGDLVGDASYFDTLRWGAGWMWDDEPDPDEAFFTPLTVDDNAIGISVRPARHTGDPAIFRLTPQTGSLPVSNSAVTTLDTLVPSLSVTRRRGEDTIRIGGRIAPHAFEEHFSLSVRRPEFYFLQLLKEKLTALGIELRGSVRLDSASGRVTLGEVAHGLDTVIRRANKVSDNIAAENLLRTIAAENGRRPGSASAGLALMNMYLAGAGVDTTNLSLADGSGVSWYNEVSPSAIVQLLVKIHGDSARFSAFESSLPVGGSDGTLKSRFTRAPVAGNVRAKTGTLRGVSALSGYVTAADGRLLAFSILCNHYPGPVSMLRDLQDGIVRLLARPAGKK